MRYALTRTPAGPLAAARRGARGLLLFTALAAVACGGGEADGTAEPEVEAEEMEEEPSVDLSTPEGVAELAKELESSDDPEAVLSKHGIDRGELEERLVEIAADEEQSKAYLDAMK